MDRLEHGAERGAAIRGERGQVLAMVGTQFFRAAAILSTDLPVNMKLIHA